MVFFIIDLKSTFMPKVLNADFFRIFERYKQMKLKNMSQKKYAVIGGGSWATAIVKMLCENCSEIGWYMRNEAAIEHLLTEYHNPNYLSSVEFDIQKLQISSDINAVISAADVVIFAIPSAFVSQEMRGLTVLLKDKIIFSEKKAIVQ
jgi:glycerol-3-phosphate dehydrogenase (NAD(P)+)